MGWDEKYHAAGAKRLPNGKMHGIAFIWDHEWNSRRGRERQRSSSSLTAR